MKQLLIFAVLLFFQCKLHSQTIQKKDASLKKKLQGAWTYETKGNATFQISEKSIYYIEHLVSYKYILKQDCITIFFDGYQLNGKIKFVKDTLFITTKTDRQKYWRFKNYQL